MKSLWNDVLRDSNLLETPLLYKNFFGQPFCEEKLIRDILVERLRDRSESSKKTFRIFVDNKPEYACLSYLCQNPPREDESLAEYFGKVFGTAEYCVIIHQADRYSEELVKRAHALTAPLAEQYGIPQLIFETGLIMGNYRSTPFAVHHDTNGRTLHLNVGPGEKLMYTWERETIRRVTQTNKSSYTSPEEIAELLPHGTCHTLDPNDFFLLPIHKYHFAATRGFTTDVVVAFEKHSTQSIIRRAVGNISSAIVDMQENFAQARPGGFAIDAPTEEWLQETIEIYSAKIRSNLGFNADPLSKPFPFGDELLALDLPVRLNHPFKIVAVERGDVLHLFLRGKAVIVPNDEDLHWLVDRLNDGETIRGSALSKRGGLLADADRLYALLRKLYEYGGVVIGEPEALAPAQLALAESQA